MAEQERNVTKDEAVQAYLDEMQAIGAPVSPLSIAEDEYDSLLDRLDEQDRIRHEQEDRMQAVADLESYVAGDEDKTDLSFLERVKGAVQVGDQGRVEFTNADAAGAFAIALALAAHTDKLTFLPRPVNQDEPLEQRVQPGIVILPGPETIAVAPRALLLHMPSVVDSRPLSIEPLPINTTR